ncbi:ankyrin repeat domain-containing protein [Dysgonomonas sp. HDW5A]|uniref:ankyrin repeat domain-containing protein n=1 Tax=unclassified Dysgonomonas TaxID=2630389 RepID=UPI00140AA6D8|nr:MULTISPECIES: ankyrin repeat domain-containing protein [unclassified Dysgonomonas]QIK55204.1 ankyrin repeat domain-containing protein [Dysgonomonas sp. HDW5B]QIK60631.1 ankyrin repeat domain-containing protein [Dysgonomonas sp. HDW5A]
MKIISFLGSFVLLFVFGFNLQAQTSKVDLSEFRLSYDEMYKIANPNLLKHRIFYQEPSQGPDAVWFDAVKRGNLEDIKKMVAAGQNIEAKDTASLGQTALGWAAFIGYMDIVEYLVEQGADIRATDKADVYNTLKSAVLGNNVEVVKYLYNLLKDESDWDAVESDGETLFMVAAVDGRLETVKFILQFNPDLNVIAPKFNVSPLSGACDRGFDDVAQLLIEKGAINHKTGKSSCE